MAAPKGNEIKFDKNNARKHSEQNKRLIEKSLSENGAGRSVLIDRDNQLIAGNGVFEQAEKLGIKTKIIETDGTELIVVKRTDLSPDDDKRRALAIADNATSDSSEWDWNNAGAKPTEWEIEEWGIDSPFVTIDEIETSDEFSLPDGDREPFQQMTFTLADAQAERIKERIKEIKQTDNYKYCETFGNENSNGNALYLLING